MKKSVLRTLGVAAGAAALAVFAHGASAQQKAPAKKPAACNSLKAEGECTARNDCNWVAESKDAKGKVTKKAYCRSNPTAKKEEPKKK